MNTLVGLEYLEMRQLRSVLTRDFTIDVPAEMKRRIVANRRYLERKIADPEARFYGINTGFGSLCNVKISRDELDHLQENLVLSHACGMGEEVLPEVVRLMVFLKIRSLGLGFSGVRLETVEKLVELYNRNIFPVVWEVGSLGASGDLAPLAHLTLPLIGRGTVRYNGEKRPTETVFDQLGISPVTLKAKEGLALLNGTQFMSAWGCWSILESRRVTRLADLTAAISIDAFNASTDPFHPAIQRVRPHKGQLEAAADVLRFLQGSEITDQPKHNVQDPYSFRCVPQVHGAVNNALDHVEQVFEVEINSVTDNPLIFEEEDLILSGGNFHGEPLALAIDYLAIAMSELASISERRTFQLVSGNRELPRFLIEHSGLNSGLMIPQYTAAAITSMNKQLATPASVDSITSSAGQEDHVSMGANAVVKAYKIVYNIEKVLAVEFMTAMQALDYRSPLKSSPYIEDLRSRYREIVPHLQRDRLLYDDIQVTVDFMREIDLPRRPG